MLKLPIKPRSIAGPISCVNLSYCCLLVRLEWQIVLEKSSLQTEKYQAICQSKNLTVTFAHQTICSSETSVRIFRWFVRPLLWWENDQWNKYNRETSYFSFNWLQLNNHPKIGCKIQIIRCKKEGFQQSALFQSQQWFGVVETTNVTENNNITDDFMIK